MNQRPREYWTSGVTDSDIRATDEIPAQAATYLKARVNSHEVDCLLDTGAEASLLPVSLVSPSQIIPSESTLRAINGTRVNVLGKATVPITIQNCQLMVKGQVTDHVTEVILGANWLRENEAQWNLGSSDIYLQGVRQTRCKASR